MESLGGDQVRVVLRNISDLQGLLDVTSLALERSVTYSLFRLARIVLSHREDIETEEHVFLERNAMSCKLRGVLSLTRFCETVIIVQSWVMRSD